MVESLMKAIASLGDQAEVLKREIEIKEFTIKKEREARQQAEAELADCKKEFEELKRVKIKKALED